MGVGVDVGPVGGGGVVCCCCACAVGGLGAAARGGEVVEEGFGGLEGLGFLRTLSVIMWHVVREWVKTYIENLHPTTPASRLLHLHLIRLALVMAWRLTHKLRRIHPVFQAILMRTILRQRRRSRNRR